MRLLALVLAASLLAGCSGGTRPSTPDPDADGLSWDDETAGWDVTIALANGTTTRHVTSDPERGDSDGDGLSDLQERQLETDPRDADTDADGLLDGRTIRLAADDERVALWRAKRLVERPPLTFLGEADLCSDIGGLKPTQFSSDRPIPDALPDGLEVRGWDVTLRNASLRVVADPCSPDADRDALRDDVEFERGTDPSDADTDDDGVRDSEDADPRWDVALALARVTAEPSGLVVTLAAGGADASIATPGSATIEIADRGAYGDLLVAGLLGARTPDGQPARVFANETGLVVTFDLVAGTAQAQGAPANLTGALEFRGPDGSVRIEWMTLRR